MPGDDAESLVGIRYAPVEHLRLGPQTQLAQTAREAPVLVFTSEKADTDKVSELEACGVEVLRTAAGGRDLAAVLEELRRREIQSLIIEGGAGVAGLQAIASARRLGA